MLYNVGRSSLEHFKAARKRLAELEKEHAKALRKLQRAEKSKERQRRRKTIHGYPSHPSQTSNATKSCPTSVRKMCVLDTVTELTTSPVEEQSGSPRELHAQLSNITLNRLQTQLSQPLTSEGNKPTDRLHTNKSQVLTIVRNMPPDRLNIDPTRVVTGEGDMPSDRLHIDQSQPLTSEGSMALDKRHIDQSKALISEGHIPSDMLNIYQSQTMTSEENMPLDRRHIDLSQPLTSEGNMALDKRHIDQSQPLKIEGKMTSNSLYSVIQQSLLTGQGTQSEEALGLSCLKDQGIEGGLCTGNDHYGATNNTKERENDSISMDNRDQSLEDISKCDGPSQSLISREVNTSRLEKEADQEKELPKVPVGKTLTNGYSAHSNAFHSTPDLQNCNLVKNTGSSGFRQAKLNQTSDSVDIKDKDTSKVNRLEITSQDSSICGSSLLIGFSLCRNDASVTKNSKKPSTGSKQLCSQSDTMSLSLGSNESRTEFIFTVKRMHSSGRSEDDNSVELDLEGVNRGIQPSMSSVSDERQQYLNSQERKDWLHLFEEAYPRRSSRLRTPRSNTTHSSSRTSRQAKTEPRETKRKRKTSTAHPDDARPSTPQSFVAQDPMPSTICQDDFVGNVGCVITFKDEEMPNSCKPRFPRPEVELWRNGGPFAVISDFSLPDKNFAKLKLDKIKMGNLAPRKSLEPCASVSTSDVEMHCKLEAKRAGKSKDVSTRAPAQVTTSRSDIAESSNLVACSQCEAASTENDHLGVTSDDLSPPRILNETYIVCKKVMSAAEDDKDGDSSRTFDHPEDPASSPNRKCIGLDVSGNIGRCRLDGGTPYIHTPDDSLKDTAKGRENNSINSLPLDISQNREKAAMGLVNEDVSPEKFAVESGETPPKRCRTSPDPSDPTSHTSPEPCISKSIANHIELGTTVLNRQGNESQVMEPSVGDAATPYGKSSDPDGRESSASMDIQSSSLTPVLMQACLEHNDNGRVLAICQSSCELANGLKTDLIAVCLADYFVIWMRNAGLEWNVLQTWSLDKEYGDVFSSVEFLPCETHIALVAGGKFSETNGRIFGCSEDNGYDFELFHQDIDSSKSFMDLCVPHKSRDLVRDPDVELIIAGGCARDQAVQKWTLDSLCLNIKKCEKLPVPVNTDGTISLCVAEGLSCLLVGGTKHTVLLWNYKSCILLKIINLTICHAQGLRLLQAESQKGLLLLTIENMSSRMVPPHHGYCVCALNPKSGKLVHLQDYACSTPGRLERVISFADSQYIACGHSDGTVQLWNKTSPQAAPLLCVFQGPVCSISLHPSRPLVAFGDTTGCVHLYSLW
ncbi:uncharacterized protein LOC116614143 isoform X1 [Nematostella vectensis]|uniref:uncharacterized protein LOC116614143 isoform X1 n=1 Tax=Nematostella vectensis TaxID=45351 RepID=UPI00207745AA|nr:uncharacterized protein LOC116614143 isoform X1 [Nematostella vectensis]